MCYCIFRSLPILTPAKVRGVQSFRDQIADYHRINANFEDFKFRNSKVLRLSTFDLRPSTIDHKFMSNLRIITLIAVSVLFLAACDTVDPISLNNLSEEDRAEAYQLALWNTGELQPSELDIEFAARALSQIRMRHGNRSWLLNNRFMPPWRMGKIYLQITEEAANEYSETGLYPWSNRDEIVQPDSVQRFDLASNPHWLYFEDDLHPGALCDMYIELSEVVYCGPAFLLFSGFSGYPMLVKPEENGDLHFYFVQYFALQPIASVFWSPNGLILYRENDQISREEISAAYRTFVEWKIPEESIHDPGESSFEVP